MELFKYRNVSWHSVEMHVQTCSAFDLWNCYWTFFSRLYQKIIRRWLLWPKPLRRMCSFLILMIMREGMCRFFLFQYSGGPTLVASLLQVLRLLIIAFLRTVQAENLGALSLKLIFAICRRRRWGLTWGLLSLAVIFLMPCFRFPLLLERLLFSKVRA